ncbi:hypothetical protein H6P81_014939 [Aristolochia fimbriata]|uniref:Uncharacterized protein n=1 Tax=Aristolochia fimbriata TaxID=158543 RepID=A0AAV7E455_ARIFI|nr:hypothetical protein H6P81_014939 [Aristolochia fimbriata]
MEMEHLDEALKMVTANISRIKWRLRPAARRRLELDILALCTGLRPVVMVDYGGKLPELQQNLCSLLHLCYQESSILQQLKVMTIEEMIYLIHDQGLAEYVSSSLALHHQLLFVDLEQDPPKMVSLTEDNLVISQLISIQKVFSSVFCVDEMDKDLFSGVRPPNAAKDNDVLDNSNQEVDELPCSEPTAPPSVFLDLSYCMQDTQVTPPILNGWLLGYPIVYLFGKDRVADAVYNLSTKSLHIFQILVSRKQMHCTKSSQEELMSFSVPYDLSLGGEEEPWAADFLARMVAKLEKCKQAWKYLRMEVQQCYPQSIAL